MRSFFCLLFTAVCLLLPAVARDEINISFTQSPNAPYLIGAPAINIDAEEFNTVILQIDAKNSGTARLFWASSLDRQMNEPKSIWFFLNKGRKEYVFNVKSQNRSWLGFIGQFALLPEGGPAGLKIESAKSTIGNLKTNLQSGWQEFWGPKGRVIEGPTVNNMRALTLWGQPVNLYIYYLTLLAAILSFGFYYYKARDMKFAWKNCGRVTVLTALAFWALLTIGQSFNEYVQFKNDLVKYDFKSLEDKRAAVVAEFGQDFYPFLKFCQANLPPRAKVKFLNTDPTGDYPEKRAGYFLYPVDIFAAKPDYLLVFNYNKDISHVLQANPGFKLLKTFNERGYILCKR